MKQIFFSGASITYGVGGPEGGWVDMIKRKTHSLEYSDNEVNELYEVYNFSKPGMVVAEALECIESDIKYRKHKNSDAIVSLSIGLNNTKSLHTPDGYISTLESYEEEISELIDKVYHITKEVLFAGYTPVDESKFPIIGALSGRKTYFINDRIALFNESCKKICEEKGVTHIDLFNESRMVDWNSYLGDDGLHPNHAGHTWMYEQVWPHIEKLLK